MTLSKFIYNLVKPDRKFLLLEILIVLFWAFDLSFRPYVMGEIVDHLPEQQSTVFGIATSIFWTGIYVFMQAIYSLAMNIYNYAQLRYVPRMKNRVVIKLTEQILPHSVNFFKEHPPGVIGARIFDAALSLPRLAMFFTNWGVGNSVYFILIIVMMSTVSNLFIILLIVWLAIYLSILVFSVYRGTNYSALNATAASEVIGQIIDVLNNIVNVRLFSRRKTELKNFSPLLDKQEQTSHRRDWFVLRMQAVQWVLFFIYQALTLYFLITGYQEGWVTAGDFVLIITTNYALIEQLSDLEENIKICIDSYGHLKQAHQLSLIPYEHNNLAVEAKLTVAQGEVEFKNVMFKYKYAKPLFNKLSFIINPGERVALVGYSGSGKTSIVNLLLRLYDIQKGQIQIDGQDIKQVNQTSLRQNLSLIPQHPTLFQRSILENLKYAKIDASFEEVVAAAKKAHIHEKIMQLPQDYETIIGAKGIALSGGEKQRLAIARAFLQNAPILLLDEVTSQLDAITENYIQDSLEQLMQQRTTIIIAHRLATVVKLDRILVFDQGKLIEDGNHQQLLAAQGLYYRMWQAQNNGFFPDKSGKDDE